VIAPAPTNPTSAAFWDVRHGVLGASACAHGTPCRSGTISLTSDGGRTFHVVERTRSPVQSVQTAGGGVAIAHLAGGDALRSVDRGRTWRPFPLRYVTSFATRDVALAFHLVVRPDGAQILHLFLTSDAGRTWSPRTNPCSRAVSASALVDLVTPRLGWIACLGQGGAGQENKAVFRTMDGARTWHREATIAGYGYPVGISFARDGFGILWETRGTLYVTPDGGAHWTAKPAVARPEIDFGRGAAALAHGRGLVLLGRGGGPASRLIATNDFGRHWRLVHRWR
jgi:photosystem II stability/assembly factor-like uncharacterized protein